MTHRCTGGFAVYVDGQPRVFAGGALVADDDPILASHRHLFEPVESHVARRDALPQSAGAVETATAGPGELRQISAPAPAKTTTRKAVEK
jgi:hypothetical protein